VGILLTFYLSLDLLPSWTMSQLPKIIETSLTTHPHLPTRPMEKGFRLRLGKKGTSHSFGSSI